MSRAGQRERPSQALRACCRDARGVVMLEVVIAFMPVFVLFLGTVQLALLGAAQLVVQHAAICGARSASVVIDDDPRFYGAPRNELWRAPGKDGPRLAAIRRAVHAPLVAIAPDASVVRTLLGAPAERASVESALGASSSARFDVESARYLPVAAALAFPLEPGSDAVAGNHFDLADRVSVRVSYLLPCLVPIVARWACESLRWDRRAQRLQAAASATPSLLRALAELSSAPSAPQQASLVKRGHAFAVLHAEATLPLQRAPYCYASEAACNGAEP
jgi:hypothetical protein